MGANQPLWHVTSNGETWGPIDEQALIAWAQSGRMSAAVPIFVRRHESNDWIPIEKTSFGAMRPGAKRTPWIVYALAGFGALAVWSFVERTSESPRDQSVAPEPPREAPAVRREPVEPPPKTVALSVARLVPLMGNHHGDEPSAAAAALSIDLLRFPPSEVWTALEAVPDNSRAEIMKEASPYLGKKLCVRGVVVQIFGDRSAGKPIWYGVLSTSGIVRFVAVGSSQGIVENTPARFCGFVTGLHGYDTQLGGSTVGVEAVGVFDLAANR